MANSNINLPYGASKSVRLAGKNASNTAERLCTGFAVQGISGSGNAHISINPTADPQVFTVTNTSATDNFNGQIQWRAVNELSQNIMGLTPYTQVPPDPAVTIESVEQ